MSPLHAPPAGVRELAIYLGARVVPALASMCLTFLCIDALGAEAYGIYSLTLLPASVAAGLLGGLSGQAMLRFADELAPGELRRGLWALPLAASAVVCPLVLGYLLWSVGPSAASVLAVAVVPLVALMDTRRSLFVARALAGSVFAMDVLRALAALAIAWLLLTTALPARIEAPLLAQLVAVGLCLWLVRPQLAVAAAERDSGAGRTRKVDRDYVGYGLWFSAWMTVVGLFSLAERSVVEAVSGLAASGRYAAQADVVNAVFAAAGGALASALMPRYLALSRAEHGPTMRRLLAIGVAGSIAAALLCVGLGGGLWLAGPERVAGVLVGDVPTGAALIAAGVVWTAAGFVQKPLELRGQTRLTFATVALSLLAFLAVAPSLCRWLGPTGVGVAKLAAGVVFVLMVLAATALAPRRLV